MIYSHNAAGLNAKCPRCSKLNAPFEVQTNGFEDVICHYECDGRGACEVCGGEPSGSCEECDGKGTGPCRALYASDGSSSVWEE